MTEDKQRKIRTLPTAEIRARLLRGQQNSAILAERVRTIGSKAQQSIVEELNLRLEDVLSKYGTLDTTIFPNAVIAKLSQLQGQEREIREQLANWESIKESKKTIDEAIALCETILIERGE